jgi:hypothetical protein
VSGRHAVLGLARVRAPWFRDVSRWSTSAALPVEFVKCVSAAELRARLASGRAWSALLVDAGIPALDRDLVDEARALGCAVVVVDDGRLPRDWAALGAAAVLPEPLRLADLLAALDEHGRSPTDPDSAGSAPLDRWDPTGTSPAAPGAGRGQLVAVTGPPGSGTSTVAAAAAQGLARAGRGPVALADLALHADQAVRHDLGDVVPGLQELVEAHRAGELPPDELREVLFALPDHGYRLLAGLRRHRDWAALRPRATEAALDGLVGAFTTTVADVDDDVEGQDECGSVEVEERNQLARAVLARADVVVVTGLPTTVGAHRLVHAVDGLVAHGVEADRLLLLVVRAPRRWPARAEVADAVAALAAGSLPPGTGLPGPVFVGEHRRVDGLVREGSPLPRSLADAVARPVAALLDRPPPGRPAGPGALRPGSLGLDVDLRSGAGR